MRCPGSKGGSALQPAWKAHGMAILAGTFRKIRQGVMLRRVAAAIEDAEGKA